LSVLFSPKGGVASKLIGLIAQAKKSVDIAIYSFTNGDVSKALITAAHSGVLVRVVMDKNQTNGSQAKIHDALVAGGVQVRLLSPSGGIMHNKFTIVDGRLVETGSYNYSYNAENVNCENALFPVKSKLDAAYWARFEKLWLLSTTEDKSFLRIRRFLRRITQPSRFL
jgi:phosphatidylserine/phosphatidylglycerophosphate/cardiolipin synthase-like enzyme